MSKYQWPTREQWAERRRTVYDYDNNPNPASLEIWPYLAISKGAEELADMSGRYPREEELGFLLLSLRVSYMQYGRQLRESKRKAGPLAQQPGEKSGDYWYRRRRMSEEERAMLEPIDEAKVQRRLINGALKRLDAERWCRGSSRMVPRSPNSSTSSPATPALAATGRCLAQ
jgi:hypothetical protein